VARRAGVADVNGVNVPSLPAALPVRQGGCGFRRLIIDPFHDGSCCPKKMMPRAVTPERHGDAKRARGPRLLAQPEAADTRRGCCCGNLKRVYGGCTRSPRPASTRIAARGRPTATNETARSRVAAGDHCNDYSLPCAICRNVPVGVGRRSGLTRNSVRESRQDLSGKHVKSTSGRRVADVQTSHR